MIIRYLDHNRLTLSNIYSQRKLIMHFWSKSLLSPVILHKLWPYQIMVLIDLQCSCWTIMGLIISYCVTIYYDIIALFFFIKKSSNSALDTLYCSGYLFPIIYHNNNDAHMNRVKQFVLYNGVIWQPMFCEQACCTCMTTCLDAITDIIM